MPVESMQTSIEQLGEQLGEQPWHRHFWVWVIIALPAAAVVACTITVWLVLQAPDAVVNREQTSQPVNDVLGRNSVAPPER
jgi:hypothetical protein